MQQHCQEKSQETLSTCNLREMGSQGAVVRRLSGGKSCLSSSLSASTYTLHKDNPGQSHQFLQQVLQVTLWSHTVPQHQPTEGWLGRDTKSAADRSPSSHLVPGLHWQWCGSCPCILPSCGTHRMAPGDCWALEKHGDMWFVWWGSNKTPPHPGQHGKTAL